MHFNGDFPFHSLFFCSSKITQPCLQVFSINSSIICSRLHLWRHWFEVHVFGEQQLVMANYAHGFNQLEMGKYFEWIIIIIIAAVFDWITGCVHIHIFTFCSTTCIRHDKIYPGCQRFSCTVSGVACLCCDPRENLTGAEHDMYIFDGAEPVPSQFKSV